MDVDDLLDIVGVTARHDGGHNCGLRFTPVQHDSVAFCQAIRGQFEASESIVLERVGAGDVEHEVGSKSGSDSVQALTQQR